MSLFIRQVALVARDLEGGVAELTAALGLQISHRDPGVAEFGLHNAVMPVGETFLEVVSPVRADASAARLLERRHGDGGYMLMLQTDDLAVARTRLAAQGVREIFTVNLDDMREVHLHPRDVGGCILSLSEPKPGPSWRWAGPDWQGKRGTTVCEGITGAILQAEEPARMATRWSEALGVDVQKVADGFTMLLGHTRVRFVQARDGRGDGLCGVELRSSVGPRRGQSLELCGVRFDFV